jgi:hypothetical protein
MDKVCRKCGIKKPLSEFYQDKRAKDGLYSSCKVCQGDANKKWRTGHTDVLRRLTKRWRIEHPDQKKKLNRMWNMEHPERVREYRKKANIKIRSTLRGKLNHRISTAMRHSLNNDSKANHHWEGLVGYTVDKLKKHIEKYFKDGMSWESFMAGEIHIDHKIPISAFNFQKPEDLDFKKCWSLKNLRPLWAKENISKKNKLNQPFQPSLNIGLNQ